MSAVCPFDVSYRYQHGWMMNLISS